MTGGGRRQAAQRQTGKLSVLTGDQEEYDIVKLRLVGLGETGSMFSSCQLASAAASSLVEGWRTSDRPASRSSASPARSC